MTRTRTTKTLTAAWARLTAIWEAIVYASAITEIRDYEQHSTRLAVAAIHDRNEAEKESRARGARIADLTAKLTESERSLRELRPVPDDYSVELGNQVFTAEQWEVIATYAKGHALSAVQDAADAEESRVLADRDREVAARAVESVRDVLAEPYRFWWAPTGPVVNPDDDDEGQPRRRVGLSEWLTERADRIRAGEVE